MHTHPPSAHVCTQSAPKRLSAKQAREKALARYVAKGGNARDGAELLASEVRALGRNATALAQALMFWNFATPATACGLAVALGSAA